MTTSQTEKKSGHDNAARRRRKGLTLLELLVSLTIYSVAIVSAVFALTSAHQLSEESRGRLLALNAARTTLETVINTPLVNIPNINTAALVPAGLRNGAVAIRTNPANLAGAQIATVTVVVTWTGPKNMPKTLEVTTMRSRF